MKRSVLQSLLTLFLLLSVPAMQFICSVSEEEASAFSRPGNEGKPAAETYTGTRATRYVDDSGGQTYTTIQSAVNAASPGDTIYVYAGTYAEDVVIGKSVILTGQDRATTIIRGTGATDAVYISANGVQMSGFTVTGTGTGDSDAAIKLDGVTNCRIENNLCTPKNFQYTSVPFSDNFDDGSISPWTRSSNYAWVSTQTYNSYRYSMYLHGDSVTTTSPNINLQGASSATLECWIRRGGSFSEDPDNGEDLLVQYYDNGHVYKTIKTFAGNGIEGQIYRENINLPAGALWNSFKIRFYLIAGSGDGYDYWHIDDVKVTKYVNIHSGVRWGICLISSNGNVISGNDCTAADAGGIVLNGSRGNDVKNNTCQDMGKGISLQGSHGNRLEYNDCDRDDSGMYISSSNGNRLENNIVNNSIVGIQMVNSIGNDIDGNDLDRNDYGIHAVNPQGTNITNNSCRNCSSKGIEMIRGRGNVLCDNNGSGSPTGIDINNSEGNVICRNNLTDNHYGIDLSSSNRNEVHNNTITDPITIGIRLDQCSFNNITYNLCRGGTKGIEVNGGSGCHLKRNNCTGSDRGIDVLTSNGTRVMQNYCSGNKYGLKIEGGELNFVSGNELAGNQYGMNLSYSDNCTLDRNDCSNNDIGIAVFESNDNQVCNNIGSKTREVISLKGSDNNDVRGNNCSGSDYGMIFEESHNNEIINNTCHNNGIYGLGMGFSYNNTISGNSFIDNSEDGMNMRYSNNFTITDNTFRGNLDDGLDIQHSDNNTIFHNAINVMGANGIKLLFSDNNLISRNTCVNNSNSGINISHSNLNEITENFCNENNHSGIDLYRGIGMVLANNTCQLNKGSGFTGIYLDRTIFFNNTLNNNSACGLALIGSGNCEIIQNILYGNELSGIDIRDNSSYNKILYNSIAFNGFFGISVGSGNKKNKNEMRMNSTSNNTLHHNDLIENNHGGVQARDEGADNSWDDGERNGNFWYDFQNRYPSASNDGSVWNISYKINDRLNVSDRFPLVYAGPRSDVVLPELLVDNTSITASTGDPFIFSAVFDDNLGIVLAKVFYSYDGFNYFDVVMNHIGEGRRESSIVVRSNVTKFCYKLYCRDISRNSISTPVQNVSVLDNDAPELEEDLTNTKASTGDPLTIVMKARDNIGINESNVFVRYSFDDIHYHTERMPLVEGSFNKTVNVSSDALFIKYSFNFTDTSGNWLNISRPRIYVYDNDPPTFIGEMITEKNMTTGDTFNFSVSVSDNMKVYSVYIRHSFFYGGDINESMVPSNENIWYTVVSIPPNATSVNYSFFIMDHSLNSMNTEMFSRHVTDNDPPLANAGEDIRIRQYEKTMFNASKSNDNIGITEYYWSFEYNGTPVELYGMNPRFTFEHAGNYSITLHATDAANNTGMDVVNLTVNPSGEDDDDTVGDDDDTVGDDDDTVGDDDMADDDSGPENGGEKGRENKFVIGSTFLLIIIGVLILVIIIIVILFAFINRKRKNAVEKRDPVEKSTPEPMTAKPMADENENTCGDCGSGLRFVDQYQKWWCDSCEKYEGEPPEAGYAEKASEFGPMRYSGGRYTRKPAENSSRDAGPKDPAAEVSRGYSYPPPPEQLYFPPPQNETIRAENYSLGIINDTPTAPPLQLYLPEGPGEVMNDEPDATASIEEMPPPEQVPSPPPASGVQAVPSEPAFPIPASPGVIQTKPLPTGMMLDAILGNK